MNPEQNAPLLLMRGISKQFPGVLALDGVDLALNRGEVLALLGENGAGKSTLIKVLAGAYRPDAGFIEVDGHQAELRTPADAQRAGISVIYQEFNLVPALTARENIFLGRERSTRGFIHHRHEREEAARLFRRIGMPIEPDAICRSLSIAQQQAVEIAKALAVNARIIVMDEPSATLTPQEVDRLAAVIRELKAQGLGIIYISHRLDEIFAMADRVLVLRDGRRVAEQAVAETDRGRLIEWMVGRKLDQEFPKRTMRVGEVRLRVEGLARGEKVRGISFSIRRGEVLGLTGLVGSGRTEAARLIFGADRADAGSIWLDDRELRIRNPRDAIRAGVGLLTEDRKAQGLVLGRSVRENFGLPNLSRLSRWSFIQQRQERSLFGRYVEQLRIRIPHSEQLARHLSGGNQQKVVLAKWLERHCEVIIFDEPTRGIDVGAKHEVYLLINELAAQGKAILMISSELPEVLGMSDRILVMHEGRIAGEILDVPNATQEDVLSLAVRSGPART